MLGSEFCPFWNHVSADFVEINFKISGFYLLDDVSVLQHFLLTPNLEGGGGTYSAQTLVRSLVTCSHFLLV